MQICVRSECSEDGIVPDSYRLTARPIILVPWGIVGATFHIACCFCQLNIDVVFVLLGCYDALIGSYRHFGMAYRSHLTGSLP